METQDYSQPSIVEKQPVLFTEKEISVGTVIGGPIVGGYLISKNFKTLNRSAEARASLSIGIFVTLLIIPIFFYMQGSIFDKIPEQLFHLLWAGVAFLVVKKYQREFIQAHVENGGKKGSGWLVFLACLVGAVLTFGYALSFNYLMTPNVPNLVESHNMIPMKNDLAKGILYYDTLHIKEQDAKVLNLLLNQVGYFNNNIENDAAYYEENGEYCIRLGLNEEYWFKPEVTRDIRLIIGQMSEAYSGRKYCVVLNSVDSKGANTELKVE